MTLKPLIVTLCLIIPAALAQDFKALVEKSQGGISLITQPLQGNPPGLLSVWMPYQDGKQTLKLLKPFAGTYRVEKQVPVVDLYGWIKADGSNMRVMDVNGDTYPEVLIQVDEAGNQSGVEQYLFIDLATEKSYMSAINYLTNGTPGWIGVSETLPKDRPDLMPVLEGAMAGSKHLVDRRTDETRWHDEWFLKNGKVKEWRQVVVTPVVLPRGSGFCEVPEVGYAAANTIAVGQQRFVLWGKYGLVSINIKDGTCKLLVAEERYQESDEITYKNGVITLLRFGVLNSQYDINTGRLVLPESTP